MTKPIPGSRPPNTTNALLNDSKPGCYSRMRTSLVQAMNRQSEDGCCKALIKCLAKTAGVFLAFVLAIPTLGFSLYLLYDYTREETKQQLVQRVSKEISGPGTATFEEKARQLETLKSEVARARQVKVEAERGLQACRSELETKQSALRAVEQQLASAQENAQQTSQTLNEEGQHLRNQVNQLRAEVQTIQKSRAQANEILNQLQLETQEAREQREQAIRERSDAVDSAQQARSELESLNNHIQQTSQQLGSLENQHTNELQSLEANRKRATEELTELQNQKDQLSYEVQNLHTQQATGLSKTNQQTIQEKERLLEELNRRIEQAENNFRDTTAKVQDAIQGLEEAQSNVELRQRELTLVEARLQELEAKLEQNTTECNAILARKTELEREITELVQRKETEAQNEVQKTQGTEAELRIQLGQAQQQILELSEQQEAADKARGVAEEQLRVNEQAHAEEKKRQDEQIIFLENRILHTEAHYQQELQDLNKQQTDFMGDLYQFGSRVKSKEQQLRSEITRLNNDVQALHLKLKQGKEEEPGEEEAPDPLLEISCILNQEAFGGLFAKDSPPPTEDDPLDDVSDVASSTSPPKSPPIPPVPPSPPPVRSAHLQFVTPTGGSNSINVRPDNSRPDNVIQGKQQLNPVPENEKGFNRSYRTSNDLFQQIREGQSALKKVKRVDKMTQEELTKLVDDGEYKALPPSDILYLIGSESSLSDKQKNLIRASRFSEDSKTKDHTDRLCDGLAAGLRELKGKLAVMSRDLNPDNGEEDESWSSDEE